MAHQNKGRRRAMERRSTEFLKTHDQIPSSFFKIMLGDFKHVLHIPLKLAKAIGCLDKQTVILRDSNSQSWRVKLSMVDGRLAFCEGWDDFVLDHSINHGQFIVFKFIEKFVFRVRIFGVNACEIIEFDEIRDERSAGTKTKTTGKTFEVSGLRSRIDNRNPVKKARKEKASTCNLEVPKTIQKSSEHAGNIYSNAVNEKRNGNSTGIKRKTAEKTFDVSGPGRKIDNRYSAKKARKESTTSNLKALKTSEKGSENVGNIHSNAISPVVNEKRNEKSTGAKRKMAEKTFKGLGLGSKIENHPSLKKVIKEKTPTSNLKVQKTIEKSSEHVNNAVSHVVITESSGNHWAAITIPVPLSELPCDIVKKLRDDETNVMFSSEKSCSWVEDVIALKMVTRKFLLTENGVCHIVDENTEKTLIDLTECEGRDYRFRSLKIGKKSQGKGTTISDKRIQDYHNRSHDMQRYYLRSGFANSKPKCTTYQTPSPMEAQQVSPKPTEAEKDPISVTSKARTKIKEINPNQNISLHSSDRPSLLPQAYWLSDRELIFPKKGTENKISRSRSPQLKLEEQGVKAQVQAQVKNQGPKRCTKCLSSKTPLWRPGPLGPKTLCNACGLRFNSGRLLPV
ncbi:uncharacterized protein A4U43_C02F13220 [Asparagus officinalis]|uniref:TF-B3 domain-containing protein n=1 Tax=Asparagus officinalis TaxID=4686 RepID=A0A5P1FI63_ASPOF|nr:uncharacterized protein LOC109829510 isoform X2 [Asparagus officinalis]ONK78006.1 uncharacterized protein A4U43_C02F13220 [Asparagus officinalis]